MYRYCHRCGAENPETVEVCIQCGETLSRRFRFGFKAIVLAFLSALGIGLVLGILVGVLLGMAFPADRAYFSGQGLSALAPLRLRLPLVLGNTISMMLAGLLVGRSGTTRNRTSAAGNTLIGLGAYALLSAMVWQATAKGLPIINDGLTMYEYIGEPIIAAVVAYFSFRVRRKRNSDQT